MKRRRPRLEALGYATVEDRANAERRWSVNEHAREEARHAADEDRVGYRRIGGELVDEARVPDRGDVS